MIHEAIHVDLGKELLNYKRHEDSMDPEARKRLVNHIRLITERDNIPAGDEASILRDILNGTIKLDIIKPVDIDKWDKEQKAYIALRQAA